MAALNYIVFLDIDGVLTTSATYTRYRKAKRKGEETNSLLFRKTSVEWVQKLCDTVGAEIVISSFWRHLYSLEDLTQLLREVGLSARVLGATPTALAWVEDKEPTRGDEIAHWLEHSCPYSLDTVRFVVLEDVEDIRPFRSKQVQTNFEGPHQGFGKKHYLRSLKILGIPDESRP